MMLNQVHADKADAVIFALIGRDAEVAARMLQAAGLNGLVCGSLDEVIQNMSHGHCLVATEEALLASDRTRLAEHMQGQEPWSDYPVILLVSKGGEVDARLSFLEGWMLCIERPFRPSTLTQAVRSAVRARRRQLEVKNAIDDRTRTAERQRLLIRELHHRVKNNLANVQALLGATARSTDTIEEFQKAFAARIVSLAETHAMLTDDYWQTASLRRMLERELRPFLEGQHRVTLKGPDIDLVADLAVPLGMAFHELTTNSVKYGALSAPSGGLQIEWSASNSAGQRELHLTWLEKGGPPVRQPTRKGFGTVLLERAVAVQLDAKVVQHYPAEGFRFELVMPLRAERMVPSY